MARQAIAGGRVVGALLWVSVAATALYWLVFFTSGDVRSSAEECYLVFERAFPAADAWLALSCAVAAVGLRRGREWAALFGICAGSAAIYLGLMDVLYNLENGMYANLGGPMIGEMVINVYCLSLGPFLIAYFWRMRDALAVRP
jgi:hypothetical protein